MELQDRTSEAISWLLDAALVRQRVVSANLANVNTPGYRAREVRFDATLEEVLRDPDSFLSSRPEPEIVERQGVRARPDGNTVDLEREMGELTRNSLLYQTYTRFLDHKMLVMRLAITGR